MKDILEALDQAERISGVINELNKCLGLFEQGKQKEALELLRDSEENIQKLLSEVPEKGGDVTEDEMIESYLSTALSQINWVSDNASREMN